MERHDLALASARVQVFDLCLRKALCLCSMFHILCGLPSCNLGTSPSPPKLLCPSICIEFMVALTPTIPWVNPL
ncbi:hypothetical protein B296_00055285 [Ensete ventricosum]|uniref:Uncharacterized protein n=1 Tax=Ensete ventricosum TaxID=4639 RepID=A0A426Y0Q3_ENSVE|nr:hypothetical protein B296_00055285 [Ensete ventricosum]